MATTGLPRWLGMLLLLFCSMAQAMTLEVRGHAVFATGDVGDDLVRFEAAFANPAVNTVVFVDSDGGSLWTALRIGRLIAQKGYRTVVAGRCLSACALMFLGGQERRFSNAMPATQTYVGLHGGHDMHTGQIITAIQTEIFAFLRQRMGARFNGAIMNQALYDMDDITAMLVVSDPVRPDLGAPFHCRSARLSREQCTRHTGESALTLGIATHDDLVEVDLPAVLRHTPMLAGRPLAPAPADLAPILGEIARRHCGTDACRSDLGHYRARERNRALAGAVDGGELTWTMKMRSPEVALLASIYRCNHAGGKAGRLCEVEMVNDHPLRAWNQEAAESHRVALAALKLPSEKFYANEQYGGSFAAANALRPLEAGGTTPRRVEGVETIGTQDLARLLLDARKPVLIDVDALKDTVPGSAMIRGVGHTYDEPAKDAELVTRIARLLALLAPDKAQPIVFFGYGRESWSAVNASLRARKLDYTRVIWYRGGVEAWTAANLPTALGVLRAVAN